MDNIRRGTYVVSITNAAGCLVKTMDIVVEQFPKSTLSVAITNVVTQVSCADESGTIQLQISGGHPPYAIQWEAIDAKGEWETIPGIENHTLARVGAGVYRAIVTDQTQSIGVEHCGHVFTTQEFTIQQGSVQLTSFNLVPPAACDYASSRTVTFALESRWPDGTPNPATLYRFSLNDRTLSLGDTFHFDPQSKVYSLNGLSAGDHHLIIHTTAEPQGCQLEKTFKITEIPPIQYTGPVDFQIGACQDSTTVSIAMADIQGGEPYMIDGNPVYELLWDYQSGPQPDGSIIQDEFVGHTPFQAKAGTYTLTIFDRNQCANVGENSVVIRVNAQSAEPFSTTGILVNPDQPSGDPVKSISPSCQGGGHDGQIGIQVNGGARPYTIQWYQLVLPTIEGEIAQYVEMEQWSNRFHLTDLSPGKYKFIVSTQGVECPPGTSMPPYNYLEEIIDIEPNNELRLLSGPFIDEDFCQGLPGRILVKIFDNNQEGLLFYYNNQQLKVDENQIDESVYTLLVDQPVEEAILQIVNADGCVLEEQINSAIGSPSFTYTSQAFDATKVILAKEEIRFTNTSKAPFIYSEWTFGDNSPIKQVPVLQQPEPITHSYAIAGTYKVNLRIYNNSGCYQDSSQFITIGEGYNIFVPNVFTPNNDGINDRFRALFSGLLSVDFHIYDHTGNLLYTEQIAEQDPDHIQGIKLEGWDGINAPTSPYYIYTVVGTLYDKSTVVEKTGTFILLK